MQTQLFDLLQEAFPNDTFAFNSATKGYVLCQNVYNTEQVHFGTIYYFYGVKYLEFLRGISQVLDTYMLILKDGEQEPEYNLRAKNGKQIKQVDGVWIRSLRDYITESVSAWRQQLLSLKKAQTLDFTLQL